MTKTAKLIPSITAGALLLVIGRAAACHAQALRSDAPFGAETGILNGVAYHISHSDGSGVFAGFPEYTTETIRTVPSPSNWRVLCGKDAITDVKECYIVRAALLVVVDSRGRSEIRIGESHYPGSDIVIRIDKGAPLAINSGVFNGSFGYRASPKIISRMARAKTITTRYQQWPYKEFEDDTLTLYGFNEALSYIKWAVARIK